MPEPTSAPARTEPATITLSQPAAEGATENPFATPEGGQPAAAEAKPTEQQTEQKTEPEKKPDADDLVLELIRRGRALSSREQAIKRREAEVAAQLKPYQDLFAAAKTAPLEFLGKVADAAGLDLDSAIEAYTAMKAGGEAKLPDNHPVRALQAEVAELKRLLADKDKSQADEAADAKVNGHISDLKALAGQTPEKFPLFNTAAEEHAYQAFDLMAAHHKAGAPITHAEAVRRIEAVLREDADKKAVALGYRKPEQHTTSTPSPTPTTAPRASTPTAAPMERVSAIRSDEEIAADWERMSRGAA